MASRPSPTPTPSPTPPRRRDDPFAPESTLRVRNAGNDGNVPDPAPSFWEGVGAAFTSTESEALGYDQRLVLREERRLLERLQAAGVDTDPLMWRATRGNVSRLDPELTFRFIQQEQQAGRLLDLPSSAAVWEREFRSVDNARIQRADEVSSRAGLAENLIGGIGGAFTDPVNVGTLPFGGFGRTIGARIGTEILVNGAIEASQQPFIDDRRVAQGRSELTREEHWMRIVSAGVGAGLIRGGIEGGQLLGEALTPVEIRAGLALRSDADNLRINPYQILRQAADEFDPQMNGLPPLERDALIVGEREVAIENANPFVPNGAGQQLYSDLLNDAFTRAMAEDPFPVQRTTFAPVTAGPVRARADGRRPNFETRGGGTGDGGAPSGDVLERYMARTRSAESGGDDGARNPRSSATGRYQFTDSTWLAYYKRRYGTGGLTDAQILARRSDGNIQDVLMRDLTEENARALRQGGEAVTEGNLYLAHFAGPAGALRVLRADPNASLRSVLGDAVIRANPFLEGRNADWLIRWAAEKMDAPVPRRGNARITFDEAGPLARLQAEGEAIQDALDAAIGRGDELQALWRGREDDGFSFVDDAVANGWEARFVDNDDPLPELRPIEGAGPPEVDWMLPALRNVVDTPGRSLNQIEQLAEELGATVPEVRAAMQHLVEQGTILQRSDGNFQRRPPRATGGDQSLLEFLAARGGLPDIGSVRRADGTYSRIGDLRSMDAHLWHKGKPFRPRLLRPVREQETGVDLLGGAASARSQDTLEDAFIAAIEAGYFPEFNGFRDQLAEMRYEDLPHLNVFLAAISDELAGAARFADDASTRSVDGELIAGNRAEQEDLEWMENTRANFLHWLEQADPRLVDDPDIEALLDDAALAWVDTGLDPVEVLRQVSVSRYQDLAARAQEELGEPLENVIPGWEPLTEDEFADFLARFESADEFGGAGGERGGTFSDPGGSGQPRQSDAEIGEQLARLPEEQRTQFLDPDGPAAKAQADSMMHDAKAQIMQSDGLGTMGREQYLRQYGDLWLRTSDELDELFDQAKLAEASSLMRAIDLIGFEPSPRLLRSLQSENFLWDRVAASIEKEANAAGKEIPEEADRILNPMWDDTPVDGLPMSEDIEQLKRAVAAGADNDLHMLSSEIGWALRDLRDISAVLEGRGSIEDQARMLTVRLATERMAELGVEKAEIPARVASAMVQNGVGRDTAAELTDIIFRRLAGDPPVQPDPPAAAALPTPRADAPTLDTGEAVDPAIAERQRQQAQLGAEAPMRAATDQDGTMGLPMFDAVDQPGLFEKVPFRLDEGDEARDLRRIIDDIEAEEAELKNIRDCL